MAGRKSSRIAHRETTQKLEKKSAILSPHDELRERLLETSIDVKENIPERLVSERNTSVGSQTSDCSDSRKRRSTKEGPAAKRHSDEKNRNGSNDDFMEFTNDDHDAGSSSFATLSQSSRTRGHQLPVMPEEEEVFDVPSDQQTESEESHEIVRLDSEYENYDELDDCEDIEQDHIENEAGEEEDDTDDEENYLVQNRDFADAKRLMNDNRLISAPSLLNTAKCQGIGSPSKVWSLMVKRDDIPRANCFLLRNHPAMTVDMRRLLVDWMMEVCESEKLHRETFHLAVDYLDRYLESSTDECSHDTFQLVGTAALFIAAKYEEIYPPKCVEFSDLTDKAFTASNIRDMEVLIVKSIGWSLGPITSIHWLSTYLQLLGSENEAESKKFEGSNLYVPKLLRSEYMQMCKVLDYLLLEVESFNFTYRTIAAAVLFVYYEDSISAVEQATGFIYEQLGEVIKYVRPVCRVIDKVRDRNTDAIPQFDQVPAEDAHNIQIHFKQTDIEPLVAKERSLELKSR